MKTTPYKPSGAPTHPVMTTNQRQHIIRRQSTREARTHNTESLPEGKSKQGNVVIFLYKITQIQRNKTNEKAKKLPETTPLTTNH